MRADIGDHGLDAEWTRVSCATPCPICGSSLECCTHVDESFACCLHEPSEWRLDNGGWLHRIARASVVFLFALAAAETRPKGASSGAVS
jgi:hypothetical protein